MACKKCDPHEICEECPEWIFTLADLIMCMMGLFVLLWVLKESGSKASTPQEAKQIEGIWLKGFQEGFQGYIPTDLTQQKPLINLNGPGAQGKSETDPDSPEGTDDQSSIIRPGREVTTGGKLLFAKGDAAMEGDLKRRLDKVADLIRGHRQIVQIKGHTSRDDLPLDATDAQKMNLSLKRAQSVADYLIARGVEPEVLRIQGCSTFEPVRQGDSTPAAQALNRRVEVFASDTLVEQLQDRQSTAAPVGKRPASDKPSGDHSAG